MYIYIHGLNQMAKMLIKMLKSNKDEISLSTILMKCQQFS